MGRHFILLILLLQLFSCTTNNSIIVVDISDIETTNPRIVLMHPTVRNLKTFIYLVDEGIFPLPENYQIIGVYHSKGSYNYNLSVDFIKKQKLNRFILIEVKEELSPELLYKSNKCSSLFAELFTKTDGMILFGGPDIPPSTYGKPTGLLTEITDVHRHYLELSFLYHLLGGLQDTLYKPLISDNPHYRVLGICLGMQSMNVATGGTMIQDIPTEIYGINTVDQVLAMDIDDQHRNYYTNLGTDKDLIWGSFHRILYNQGSLFDSLNGFTSSFPYIWSSHHQCIDKLGKGIVSTAWSIDGKIIEAVSHAEYPNILGVQFHPEINALYNSTDKLKQFPQREEEKSYIDLYAGSKGEDFHRALWNYFGEKF